MRKILQVIIFLAISALMLFSYKNVAKAASSPFQISISYPNLNCFTGVFYGPTNYTFDYSGGTVTLASASDGTGNIYTDDQIDIEITHPDTTKSTFSQDYGSTGIIVQTVPQIVTSLFKTGANNVKITLTNLRTPQCGSSAYWLVESAGGGGGPTKPNILPRSGWHGDNSGANLPQTPVRIAIHHTSGTNDPGNIGTRLKELELAAKLQPSITLKKIFNPLNVLSGGYDSNYAAIRSTYEGSIFLEWLDHKYLHPEYGIDDIAYNYLITPDGKIYEGRYKGNLAENAENKGSSVYHANTGLIGIAFVGRYGIDAAKENQIVINLLDNGILQPTGAEIQSAKSLIDWLTAKYGINKTGQTKLPPSVNGITSCVRSQTTNECNVDNIAGHKDYAYVTQDQPTTPNNTVCPGDALYSFLPTFRFTANNNSTATTPVHINPFGLIFGGFSPVNLGVVDPTGNRLGIDPATGQFVNNIAGGTHGKILNGEDPNNTEYVLHIISPINGVYKVDVVGTGTGAFILGTEDLATSNASAYSGNTTSGQKDNYQVIYNSASTTKIEMFHDTVAPVTTGTMTCSRDMNSTCRSAATFKLAATDTGTNGDPASGVLKIECSYDNKATWQQCGDANGATIVRNTNGQFSFWYRSTDRVLNIETPKYSGIADIEQFLSIADTTLNSNLATTLKTTGIMHSNGNITLTNNTTLKLDIVNYIGTYTQSGNRTFTYNSITKVAQRKPLPTYSLSFYKSKCTNYTGAVTLWDTGTNFNKCIYATGDVTIYTTNTRGKLTIVSEGNIKDYSTGANLQAWDTINGILLYSAKTYTAQANGAIYTGVIYVPNAQLNGGLSNSTLNGSLYSKYVNFNSGTSLTASQAAGFPALTYNLPL
jgi:hypothetical protein